MVGGIPGVQKKETPGTQSFQGRFAKDGKKPELGAMWTNADKRKLEAHFRSVEREVSSATRRSAAGPQRCRWR